MSIHDEIPHLALGCLNPSRTLTDDQIIGNCTNLGALPNSCSRHAIAPLLSRDDTGLRWSSCLRAYTAGHFHGLWPRLCNNPQYGLAVTTMWAGWSSNVIYLCRTHIFGGLEGKSKSRMVIKNQTLSRHKELMNASPKVRSQTERRKWPTGCRRGSILWVLAIWGASLRTLWQEYLRDHRSRFSCSTANSSVGKNMVPA